MSTATVDRSKTYEVARYGVDLAIICAAGSLTDFTKQRNALRVTSPYAQKVRVSVLKSSSDQIEKAMAFMVSKKMAVCEKNGKDVHVYLKTTPPEDS